MSTSQWLILATLRRLVLSITLWTTGSGQPILIAKFQGTMKSCYYICIPRKQILYDLLTGCTCATCRTCTTALQIAGSSPARRTMVSLHRTVAAGVLAQIWHISRPDQANHNSPVFSMKTISAIFLPQLLSTKFRRYNHRGSPVYFRTFSNDARSQTVCMIVRDGITDQQKRVNSWSDVLSPASISLSQCMNEAKYKTSAKQLQCRKLQHFSENQLKSLYNALSGCIWKLHYFDGETYWIQLSDGLVPVIFGSLTLQWIANELVFQRVHCCTSSN